MAPDEQDPKPARRTQAQRNAETRAALVEAAHDLFGSEGYEHVSTTEIVSKAGVTRGALYHHFEDKRGLFEAVFESVEAEATRTAASAALHASSAREAAIAGARSYLEFCRAPDVRRILFVDSRAVIDDARLREITEKHGGALIRALIAEMIEQRQIKDRSIEMLAAVISGILIEGATYAANASDRAEAVEEIVELFDDLLAGLAPG